MSNPFDFVDTATPKSSGPSGAVLFVRFAIWGIVALWCVAPVAWLLYILISSGAHGMPREPGPGGFATQIMSSALMVGAFTYALWCAVGVICGIGFEHALIAIYALARTLK